MLALAGVLFGVTAAAAVSPLLDDVIRGLTLGGGLGTLIAYRRYQRTGRDPFIIIARWTILGAAFGVLSALSSSLRSRMRFTKRTWLAFLVAAILGVPSCC